MKAPRLTTLSKLLAAQLPNIQVRVTDNGEGMSGEITGNLFVPFFTTREGGSGVGLALARQVMIAHGGFIRLVRQEGAGAVFVLTF